MMDWSLVATVLLIGLSIVFCVVLGYLSIVLIERKFGRPRLPMGGSKQEAFVEMVKETRKKGLTMPEPVLDDIPPLIKTPKVETSFGEKRIGEVTDEDK